VNSIVNRAVRIFCALAAASFALASVVFSQTPSPNPGTTSERAAASVAVPSADRILDKYLEATGGRAAWEKIHSRVSTGTVEIPEMKMSGTAEMWEKAPDSALVKMVISGSVFLEGFDGKSAWSSDPKDGLQEQKGLQLAETRRGSDFRFPVDFRRLYPNVVASGERTVAGRPTYVVEATPPEGGQPDRAFFDPQTGLLVHIVTQHHNDDGSVEPFEEDFGDYRAVDGVKIPFMIHQSGSQVDFTIRISEVHQNVAVDDTRFSKPVVQ
jgi:hypothetical protein